MPAEHRPLAPGTARLGRFLLLLGSLALGFLVVELGVRAANFGPDIQPVFRESYRLSDNPVLRYELRPGSNRGPVRINDQGMRDVARTRDKPAGVFRIASLGDSIAFGYGVRADETYSRWLEVLLNRYYASSQMRYEVLNFGVTGYNVEQAAEVARVRAMAYAPDLLLYGYCLNDAQQYSFEWESLRSQLNGAENRYWARLSRGGESFALRSRVFLLARYLLDSRQTAGRNKGPVKPEPDWQSLERGRYADYFAGLHHDTESWQRVQSGFAGLGAIGHASSIPVYVAIFPVLRDLSRHPLAAVHARVVHQAETSGLRPIDLAPLFRSVEEQESERLHHDALHPNELGHALAAMAILQVMLDQGQLPAETNDLRPVIESGRSEAAWAAAVSAE
jgi:lysophospholipase L1-like esterase